MIGEITMKNDNLLQYINERIHNKTGIFLPPEKKYLLIHKITRMLKNNDYNSLYDFCQLLKNNNKDGINNLINNITTNHTFFFREKSHLMILANDIKNKKNSYPLIWCAASSTGEEVYSIIISLLENKISNFKIIASDINSNVIFHMKRGIYNESRLVELNSDMINKYFTKCYIRGDCYYKIKDYLKKFYIAKKINLIDNIKFENRFDYIFCRNVLMYFNNNTQESVIDMLLNNLDDYGYLFVGHSESLMHMNKKLESVFSSVYNKKQ